MSESFDFDAFVDGYIECALWADCYPAEPTDEEIAEYARDCYAGTINQGILDAARERLRDNAETGGREDLEPYDETVRATIIERGQLREFVESNLADLLAYCEERPTSSLYDSSQGPAESYAGHDLWLTRTGHGTGFWDRGLGELGDRLTDACKSYGSGDDHTPWDNGDGTYSV